MLRLYSGEEFKVVKIDYPLRKTYEVSSRGRVVSYYDTFEKCTVLKGSMIGGYTTLRYKMFINGKIHDKMLFIHKLVADLFIPRTAEDQKHVLHLDFDKANNHIDNLKWVNYEEKLAHYEKSPNVIRARENLLAHNIKSDGRKLTVTNVIHLKKLIADPKRKTRFKILAKRFGISEMQLYRIKSGENWGHIKI
jgi:hypothetical protein